MALEGNNNFGVILVAVFVFLAALGLAYLAWATRCCGNYVMRPSAVTGEAPLPLSNRTRTRDDRHYRSRSRSRTPPPRTRSSRTCSRDRRVHREHQPRTNNVTVNVLRDGVLTNLPAQLGTEIRHTSRNRRGSTRRALVVTGPVTFHEVPVSTSDSVPHSSKGESSFTVQPRAPKNGNTTINEQRPSPRPVDKGLTSSTRDSAFTATEPSQPEPRKGQLSPQRPPNNGSTEEDTAEMPHENKTPQNSFVQSPLNTKPPRAKIAETVYRHKNEASTNSLTSPKPRSASSKATSSIPKTPSACSSAASSFPKTGPSVLDSKPSTSIHDEAGQGPFSGENEATMEGSQMNSPQDRGTKGKEVQNTAAKDKHTQETDTKDRATGEETVGEKTADDRVECEEAIAEDAVAEKAGDDTCEGGGGSSKASGDAEAEDKSVEEEGFWKNSPGSGFPVEEAGGEWNTVRESAQGGGWGDGSVKEAAQGEGTGWGDGSAKEHAQVDGWENDASNQQPNGANNVEGEATDQQDQENTSSHSETLENEVDEKFTTNQDDEEEPSTEGKNKDIDEEVVDHIEVKKVEAPEEKGTADAVAEGDTINNSNDGKQTPLKEDSKAEGHKEGVGKNDDPKTQVNKGQSPKKRPLGDGASANNKQLAFVKKGAPKKGSSSASSKGSPAKSASSRGSSSRSRASQKNAFPDTPKLPPQDDVW
ncbi:hypothetical protein QBC41DRAFT_304961 [Cercophora samala]|uniref:Uncharacterized protein n=1 Tax=Cercophora samala TaxID=330535 RepID=A0AA40D8A3_9PEZI|nr:hypothetical protein QBC41DRAFT_304961 [Cercophora samala]